MRMARAESRWHAGRDNTMKALCLQMDVMPTEYVYLHCLFLNLHIRYNLCMLCNMSYIEHIYGESPYPVTRYMRVHI